MARQRRIRHAAHEIVPLEYVERHARKGWLERDFNVAGAWFLWRRNIQTKKSLIRFGVRGEPKDMELS